MPVITASKTQPAYDVVIVGSGAGGGQSAYTLAMAGAKVLVLEAGRHYDPVRETPMFQENFRAPLRGADTAQKPFGFYDATIAGGWTMPGEPYTNARGESERQFDWWRTRMLGGRTNHWGRIALRNGPYDFKPRNRDGLGVDWPIGYADLAPYYDRVERLIGVYGSNEGLENTPNSPQGVLLPPPKARVGELLAQNRAKQLGIPIIPAHRAVLSRAQDAATLPALIHPGDPRAQRILGEAMRGRAPCFWATPCGRGCAIKANYQSTTVHFPPALATGNLDILPDAMVREVTLDKSGRADGVSYVNAVTGQEGRVRGRVIVLAASAVATARILLCSQSARFPQGLANRSGKVGKGLMDTVGASVGGQVPLLENLPPHNEDGAGGDHMYSPWWLYREQRAGQLDFPRGYHIEFRTGRAMPGADAFNGLSRHTGGSYGRQLKEDARRFYGSFLGFSGRGEMIPNDDCFCELDPVVKDKWGIPAIRFHWKWSEHEIRQVAHMQKSFGDIIEAMGGTVTSKPTPPALAIERGGRIIHEVGGTVMGTDPATSVTNSWCQTWDAKNLFIADGGPFCSNADKNPTLTIMALAWRTSDHILEEMQKGNI